MTNTRYNGWINRETWVYNLHFGDEIFDQLSDLARDGYFDDCYCLDDIKHYIAAYSEQYMDEIFDQIEGHLAAFFADFMDQSLIDHDEMMEHMVKEIFEILTEEAEELDEEDKPDWFTNSSQAERDAFAA